MVRNVIGHADAVEDLGYLAERTFLQKLRIFVKVRFYEKIFKKRMHIRITRS